MNDKKNQTKVVKSVFDDLIKIYGVDYKFNELKIKEIWREKMGEAINNKTSKIQLFNGTLSIHLDSGVLKQEFSFAKEKIKSMINEEMGELIVQKVEIR